MIKKLCFGIVAVAVLASAAWAETADEIIAKNIQARGGADKMSRVQTLKATATMAMGPGMEAPVVLIQKKGNLARLEFTIQGLTGVQAYDGKTAWQVLPFIGKKDAEVMAADEAKDIQEMAEIGGPLFEYKNKGHQVELLGKDKVEGADAYKLKLTLKNGDVETVYIDADSFLEIKKETKRTIRGTEQDIEESVGNYKEVDGIFFPFVMESGVKGSQQKEKLTITRIELNIPADDSIFKMPPPAPAAPPAPPDTPKS
jgi:outer membrane lipoprotein-sorting protein